MPLSQSPLKSLRAPHFHVAGEICPWCEQPLPEDESEKILARIRDREDSQKAYQEDRLRQEFARKEAEAKKRFEVEKAAAAAKAREDAANDSARLIAQVRKESADQLAAAAKSRAEADQKHATEIEQLKKRAAEKEASIRADAVSAAKVEAATQIETARKAAADANRAAAESAAKLEAAEEGRAAEIAKVLTEAREAHEKDKSAAVNAERSKNFNDKLKLEEQVKKLQRQLEQKTAGELGEGAEIDLLDQLKGAFKGDHIQHVGKGKAGADIIHEVMLNGKVCGRIIYDSKNRLQWRDEYATKLRDDQIAAKAEYAVLSSNVFPSGAKQLYERDGVIIASPARVLILVQILRRTIVQMHTLSLSNRERAEKTAALYAFIRSDGCKQLFERIGEHTDGLLELQVKDKKQHEAMWEKQGNLVRAIQKASGGLTYSIDRIIGTAE
jgi:hypothetical protein